MTRRAAVTFSLPRGLRITVSLEQPTATEPAAAEQPEETTGIRPLPRLAKCGADNVRYLPAARKVG